MINVGEHLAATSIVTGVAEAEPLDESAGSLIIFSRPDPDRVAASFARPLQCLVHDRRTMATATMIGMNHDLGPHEMQVVPGRHVQRKYTDRVGSVRRCVEIALLRFEVPAVTEVTCQNFWDGRKVVGVVNPTRRILEGGDRGDLCHVVRLDAFEGH